MELTEIRVQIDAIDRELTRLFAERMALSDEVAAYKQAHGLPILDAARERSKLAELSAQAPEELQSSLALLYQEIFALSRARQARLLQPETELTRQIAATLDATPKAFPSSAAIACQGVEGAFSQQAAQRLFRHPEILYFSTFEGVFKAIQDGLCAYGILPIENSTAGSVDEVYDLMQRYRFSVVRMLRLKVDQCLLAQPGASLSGIREILSHPQAISQSQRFLHQMENVTITLCANTAEAARQVAASGRSDLAAIGSRDCAALYGLQVLEDSVQDSGSNFTRFICICRDLEIFPGADRTSIMLTLPHRPGALYQVLSRIHALGINLSKLESRPLPNRDFAFMFYLDLEVSVYAPAFLQLMRELEPICEQFCYLGSYNEVV